MNFNRVNLIITQSTRFLIVAFACTVIFFASALPVFAIGSAPSNPTKGEVSLDKIQEKTDISTYDPPITIEEIQKRSQAEKGGINEIQGTADANKMKNSGNSQQANTAIDNIKDLFKKAEKK